MARKGRFADRIIVIMPTYNERDNVVPITARVRSATPGAELLIVDDNSPDGTGKIADELAAADSHIHVLHRRAKAGLGSAYLAGFRWALQSGYDVIVEMDADGSHQPEELPRLLATLVDADIALGSRWVPGGKVVNWPTSRKVLSCGGSVYARVMLGIPLRDVTGGYRAYRASALRKIGLDNVESMGYCFQIDLALRAIEAELTVVEVPITFVDRTRGSSKMSSADIREALGRVTRWGIAKRFHQASRRLPGMRPAARSRRDQQACRTELTRTS